jgi:hypothetical protein
MSNLTSSIVRGFGFSLGRAAANSLLQPSHSKEIVLDTVSDIKCMSHKGYEENDVEILYDIRWRKQFIRWWAWIFFTIVPITNIIMSLIYCYKVFIRTYNIHFYELKWNTYKVSDGRTKSGFREVKKLGMEYCKSEIDSPCTRNKIEAIVSLLISLIVTIPMIYGIIK